MTSLLKNFLISPLIFLCLSVFAEETPVQVYEAYIGHVKSLKGSVAYPGKSDAYIDTLKNANDPALIEAIREGLKSYNSFERAAAIHAASVRRDPVLIDAILNAVNNQQDTILGHEASIRNLGRRAEGAPVSLMASHLSQSLHCSAIELAKWIPPNRFWHIAQFITKRNMGKSFTLRPLGELYVNLALRDQRLLERPKYIKPLVKAVMSGRYQTPALILNPLIPHFATFGRQNDLSFLDIAEKLYKNNFPSDRTTAMEIARHFDHPRATWLLQKISYSDYNPSSRKTAQKTLRNQGKKCGILAFLATSFGF